MVLIGWFLVNEFEWMWLCGLGGWFRPDDFGRAVCLRRMIFVRRVCLDGFRWLWLVGSEWMTWNGWFWMDDLCRLDCSERMVFGEWLYNRVQRFLKFKKSPTSVARRSSVLILKNICNFLCVVLAPELWHEVIEIEVQEFELPGKTE